MMSKLQIFITIEKGLHMTRDLLIFNEGTFRWLINAYDKKHIDKNSEEDLKAKQEREEFLKTRYLKKQLKKEYASHG